MQRQARVSEQAILLLVGSLCLQAEDAASVAWPPLAAAALALQNSGGDPTLSRLMAAPQKRHAASANPWVGLSRPCAVSGAHYAFKGSRLGPWGIESKARKGCKSVANALWRPCSSLVTRICRAGISSSLCGGLWMQEALRAAAAALRPGPDGRRFGSGRRGRARARRQ